jgi:hypothetical protein
VQWICSKQGAAVSVQELDACFVVRDHNGQALAYVYFEDELGQALRAAKLLAVKGRSGFRPIPPD